MKSEEHAGRTIQRELNRQYPMLVGSPGGIYVTDDSGKTLLDAAAGVGVLSLGYDVPEIVHAMATQASKLPYVHALRFGSEPAQELASELARLTPDGLDNFSFCSGGSEAVETAMKIARQYHLEVGQATRFRFIGRWQSFHGNTIATQSVGGHLARRTRHAPLLIDFPHVEAPDCYRCESEQDHRDCVQGHEDALRLAIERAGPETVAGIVLEVVTGASSGAHVPPAGYLEAVRRVCDDYGVLMIVDEVYTAFGRTGREFASDHWGVLPDIITMGKGMSAGFAPMGGVAVSNRLIQAFASNSGIIEHNFTFAAHPVSCSAAIAAIGLMREKQVTKRAGERGEELKRSLGSLTEFPSVGDVRGLGLMVGVEFVQCRDSKEPYPRSVGFASRVAEECYRNNLIVYPGSGSIDGIHGDHLLLTPPLIISTTEIEELSNRLYDSIKTVTDSVARR